MHTDGRYLNTGSGKTEQIPFPTAQSHGGKSRFRAIVLRQFLIQTDVPLFVIMGENGTNPAKKYGHSRMTTSESMIQILENGGRDPEYKWQGTVVRVYFPDEGSAAFARRDWNPTG